MKKTLIILFVISLLIAGYSYDKFAWCKKLITGEPTTHVIQKGESFSKIAKQYYGNKTYWRELALINRSPNSDLVFPGEAIVIPSLNTIKEIRRTRWMTKVNTFMQGEQDILARLNQSGEPTLAATPQTPMPDSKPEINVTSPANESVTITDEAEQMAVANEDVKAQSSSSLGLILGIIAVLIIASLVAYMLIRRRKRSEQISIVDDKDLNLIDDSEPDYQDYLRKKSRRKKEAFAN
ncbi:MAG: LysM peptidoglycan-binding domain-containing protein [bacterium]|nr:LysM peptidoglycan-binding domain-containing protein [bacterium]